MVDEDFGKTFDFNRYVSYTLRTKRIYSYSEMECDFQMIPIRAPSPYCYLDIKLRPGLATARVDLTNLYDDDEEFVGS